MNKLIMILLCLMSCSNGEYRTVCVQGHQIHAEGFIGTVFIPVTDFETAKAYADGRFFFPSTYCREERIK